ncbi:MAG: GTPase ObgE [Phycisphaeraceae bacterium]
MLIDQAIIQVRAGAGGDGKVAFRREKYIPKGGPSGGDGGQGGNVYLLAQPGVDTLLDFSGTYHWKADDGEPGGVKQCTGHNGQDLIIQLPPGTLVFDQDAGKLIVDMDRPGMRYLICKGGRAGWGNEHFKSPTNQAPHEAQPGSPGQERMLRLELKLIADIGFVGKPNAGKSTLLSRVSRATPKIADYPFTTLEPQLGIAELPGARRMVMADLPGLIQGASHGVGLGFRFLRHVERTRLLVHLLEVEPTDGSNPIDNYRAIRQELNAYSAVLTGKPEIVVLSKMDLYQTQEDQDAAAQMIEAELGIPTLRISAATGQGIEALLERCWEELAVAKLADVPVENGADEPGDDEPNPTAIPE